MKKYFFIYLIVLLFVFAAHGEASVAADGAHVLCVDASGGVWAWGSNHRGESDAQSSETRILSPVRVFENASAVACGQQFSMALTKDANLYAWGDNRARQIPSSDADRVNKCVLIRSDVVSIDACDTYAACVTSGGSLFAWGNGEGEALLSENAAKCAVGLDFVLELDKSGNVYEHREGEKTLLLSGCSDISASGESRYALSKNNKLYAWGANASDGRLGLEGSEETVSVPTVIYEGRLTDLCAGLSASGIITEEKTLLVWGSVYSHLTAFSDEGDVLASLTDGALIAYANTPLPIYESVSSAAFGDAFVCVLFEDGDVFTWGSNDHGQLGNGSFTETALYENEEDGGYDLTVVNVSQGIFPSVPLNLETAAQE